MVEVLSRSVKFAVVVVLITPLLVLGGMLMILHSQHAADHRVLVHECVQRNDLRDHLVQIVRLSPKITPEQLAAFRDELGYEHC